MGPYLDADNAPHLYFRDHSLSKSPSLNISTLSRSPSPNLLTSVKNLVPLSLRRSRSPLRSHSSHDDERTYEPRGGRYVGRHATISSPRLIESSRPLLLSPSFSLRSPHNAFAKKHKYPQRQHIQSMADYMTLEELEGIWSSQDFYGGSVEAPQKVQAPPRRSLDRQTISRPERPTTPRIRRTRSQEARTRTQPVDVPSSAWTRRYEERLAREAKPQPPPYTSRDQNRNNLQRASRDDVPHFSRPHVAQNRNRGQLRQDVPVSLRESQVHPALRARPPRGFQHEDEAIRAMPVPTISENGRW